MAGDNDNQSGDLSKFFGPAEDEHGPKPAGPFTQAFGSDGAGVSRALDAPTSPPGLESGAAKIPSAFTAQFGNVNLFTPIPEKPQPATASERIAEVPSALGESPLAGAFTRMFGSAAPSKSPIAGFETESTVVLPEPAKSSEILHAEPERRTPSGSFTDVFAAAGSSSPTWEKTPSTEFPPMGLPSLERAPELESKPGAYTQLINAARTPEPAPAPARPAGELTRMIAGDDPALQSPAPSRPSFSSGAAAEVLNPNVRPPIAAPEPAGPSPYTVVVKGSQLRQVQQQQFAGAAAPQGMTPAAAPAAAPAWGGLPTPVPPPAPAFQVPMQPPAAMPSPQWPGVNPQMHPPQFAYPPAPAMQPPPPALPSALPPPQKPQSKLMTYLPLIIGLNALLLIALIVIILFAIKR